ncbi:CBU_0592 family membrane protein [Georgenia subflava]|uniref:CBU-0592-like domain-containing protein n=1 Tax=Georgenia subflava TaxID=1622177 RepID=A0A6N7EF46_9MICO|nr:hypothetical protein [Georgenia subflava]MPV36729.1 hypothetical protein [Georgenia subflava]
MNDVLLTVIATLGWVGVLAQLIAYALLTRGRLEAVSVRYQGLNVVGAMAVGLSSASSGAWPSAVANLIWIAIGVLALLSLRRLALVMILRRQVAKRREAMAAARARVAARRTRVLDREAETAPHLAGEESDVLQGRPLQPGSTRPAGRSPRGPRGRNESRRKASVAA